jgi:hypothetical protein
MNRGVGSIVRSLADDVGCIRDEMGTAIERLQRIEKWREEAMPEVMATVRMVQRASWVISGASVVLVAFGGLIVWTWMQDHGLLLRMAEKFWPIAEQVEHQQQQIDRLNQRR